MNTISTNTNANMANKNLDLYIPRASLRVTEQQVRDIFFRNQIGIVDYCDLVVIKDKETKEPSYLSIFLKLDAWNPLSSARETFDFNGSIKIYINTTEFWIILPNKNPLPRTHVNTSQLAASTEKLFEQNEKITEKFGKFEDEMRAEMAEMRLFMKLQQQSIDALKTELATANNKILELTLENDEVKYQLKRSTNAIFGYDTIDAYDEAEKKKREEKKQEEDKKLQDKFDAELDEILDMPLPDNALAGLSLMPPKVTRCSSIGNWDAYSYACESNKMFIYPKAETCEDECIFSSNPPRRTPPIVSPIQVQNVSPAKPQTLTEIVLEHPDRAIASRDFCGNF